MKKQITVFLVEDDKDLADIYCTKFKQAGFICQHMQTGSGATEMIQKNIPDVAILDVMLPQKNGFEILQEIRANIKTKHMPVIMLTSLGNGFDVRQGIKNGADKYLVKTEVTPTQIVEEINNLLK
ncbi:MAG: sensor histidine kinase/response regulator [uncultured bacterium]|nr:MAG: sensor histidine kinase/response regulator [uncultured bacterium]